jgi:glycosyltransferase involved in cell wall biosynthesis
VVHVVTTNANGPQDTLRIDTRAEVQLREGLRVRYCQRVGRHSVAPTAIRPLVASVRAADVVHLTAVYSFTTFPTLMACRVLDKPLVWSTRGSLQRWAGSTRTRAKSVWERACRILAPARLRLHVTSSDEAQASMHRFYWAQAHTIPNGVELPDAVDRSDPGDNLRLTFLGRLHPIKGLDRLIDACKLLWADGDQQWSLVIAGTGEQEYSDHLRKRVAVGGLGPHVRFVGQVTGERKRELLANTDIVVLPSHIENFGMVVAESLAHAVPVIASRGTPWSRVEEVGCGVWVDNTPEALAESIRHLRERPLRGMGEAGRQWMSREFGWRSVAGRMIDLYREVMVAAPPVATRRCDGPHDRGIPRFQGRSYRAAGRKAACAVDEY